MYPVGRHIGLKDVKENITSSQSGGNGQGQQNQGSSSQAVSSSKRSGMKFIKQHDIVKEITSMILSPNKRFLAVCERHRNENSTFIAIYDVKNLFKTTAFKERMKLNVADLFPAGAFT
jgi:hypothetical protein